MTQSWRGDVLSNGRQVEAAKNEGPAAGFGSRSPHKSEGLRLCPGGTRERGGSEDGGTGREVSLLFLGYDKQGQSCVCQSCVLAQRTEGIQTTSPCEMITQMWKSHTIHRYQPTWSFPLSIVRVLREPSLRTRQVTPALPQIG